MRRLRSRIRASGRALRLAAVLAASVPAVGTAGFVPAGPGGGGALFAPSISPHDPNLMTVACDMGGVYITYDGGQSWTMLDKRAVRDGWRCPVLFHPQYASWLYASGAGGLKLSKDAGHTWTMLCPNQPWAGEPLTALACDELEPRLMFAGCGYGAFRSRDGGASWGPCPDLTGPVTGFFVDPTTPPGQRIVVAGTGHGVRRSDDSGSHWRDSSAGLPAGPVLALAGGGNARSGRVVFYALVPARNEGGAYVGGLYRSDDHGTTWHAVMHGAINRDVGKADAYGADDLARYTHLGVVRETPDTAVVATAGTGYWPPHHDTLWRTDDGGASWRFVVTGDPRSASAVQVEPNIAGRGWIAADGVWGLWGGSHGGLAVSRTDPNRMAFTNDGELYLTADGGASWRQAYTRSSTGGGWTTAGLDVTSVWDAAFDPANPKRVVLACTDIGTVRSEDGGWSWRWTAGTSPWRNTCYRLAADPARPGRLWGAWADQHDLPHWTQLEGPTGGGGVCVSEDFGATWTPTGRGLPDRPVTSVVVDPRSPADRRILYAAVFGASVFVSTDGGASWRPTPAQPGGPDNRHVYRLLLHPDGTLLCTITGRRVDKRFPVPGGLFATRDGGRTWTDLAGGLGLSWPGDVAADPANSRVLYLGAASVPGAGEGGVYKTEDGGGHWKRVLGEESLPQELSAYGEVLFVSVDPRAPSIVYAGATTHGLFVSHDAGRSWAEERGLPFTACQRVAFEPAAPGRRWILTFGGGAWRDAAP